VLPTQDRDLLRRGPCSRANDAGRVHVANDAGRVDVANDAGRVDVANDAQRVREANGDGCVRVTISAFAVVLGWVGITWVPRSNGCREGLQWVLPALVLWRLCPQGAGLDSPPVTRLIGVPECCPPEIVTF
jgi:hypothetical protein